MKNTLDVCLDISHAHASLTRKLDDELGTLHGLAYNDFLLLTLLSRADGASMAVAELARPMGVPMSALVRQLMPLEKTGLLRRDPYVSADGRRHVALLPGGRRLVKSATITAQAVCDEVISVMPAAGLAQAHGLLSQVRHSRALEL